MIRLTKRQIRDWQDCHKMLESEAAMSEELLDRARNIVYRLAASEVGRETSGGSLACVFCGGPEIATTRTYRHKDECLWLAAWGFAASNPPLDGRQPCEGSCQPYVAKCGARFCTSQEQEEHDEKHPRKQAFEQVEQEQESQG